MQPNCINIEFMEQNFKKAVIITGPRFQDHEYIYPYYRLQEAGFKLDIATKNKETVLGDFGTPAVATMDTADLKNADFDLIVLPGGAKALEKVRQEKVVIDFLKEMHNKKRIIAGVCHGPQLMISAGILKGKRATAYYSIADDIRNAGAEYVDAPVVVDGNLVTSPHYKYMPEFMKETLAKFNLK